MIIAEGSLSDRPLPRTFAAVGARGFSGELVVRAPGREFHIAWHDGAVVGATSPHPADSAVKVAVTLGLLNSTQASEANRAIAASPGGDEVEVVGQVAKLSAELVSRLGRRLAATRAARVFSVENGVFTLDSAVPTWGTVAPVDPRWIMYAGVCTHYTVDRLHREVTGLAAAIRLRPGADLTSFGFGEAEAEVLTRLQAGELSIEPAPAGLDSRVVEAVALVLLAVGDAEPTTADVAPSPAPPVAARRPPTSTIHAPPPVATPRAPARRPRGADPAQAHAVIADRLAALDGGADHFTLLGVTPDTSPDAVRAAYFRLARHLHPDRLAAAGITDELGAAHRVFAKINEAFAVLSTPDRRAEYVHVQRAGGAQVVRAQAEAAEAQVRQALDGEEAYRRGELALRRQQLDDALTQFKRAVELGPDEADHHAMLGWAHYVAATAKAAALPIARDHLKRAIDRAPKSPLAHLLLGRIARMEGEDAAALTHLRRALELAPGNPEIASELRTVEARRAKAPETKGLGALFGRKKP